jgi:predicted nuclease of predicted toxin-antitoxin system
MSKAADEEILAWSLGKNAIVVTLDADFHTILAVTGASGPSVIRLRIQGLGAPEVVGWVQKVLAEFRSDLERGSLVTVKARKTTCHRLPVGGSD